VSTILPNDSNLRLPDFALVSASAGSGKTHTLTHRYLQFILSDRIPHADLKNILAITFTNNAAIEMKGRILEYLKKATFGDEETLNQLNELLSYSREELSLRTEALVDDILDSYSDFQVQTIDSFLSRVMRVSALDFGLPAQFELVLESDPLLDEAFDLFAEQIATDPQMRQLVEVLIARVNENQGPSRRFLWNPYDAIAGEVKNIYRTLISHVGQPAADGSSADVRELEHGILRIVGEIGRAAGASGSSAVANYQKIIDAARAGDFASVIGKKLDQKVLKVSKDPRYDAAAQRVGDLQQELKALVSQYTLAQARLYYQPYIRAYLLLRKAIDSVRLRRGEIDLGDAGKRLASSLQKEQVPEIYFSLGERIHHYLIDEFQDTNPIQWAALRPLVEESLGKEGSLFIVGDTKQAIYTFRGGDWKIMARMMNEEEFPSAPCKPVTLPLNYRSSEAIVKFSKNVFHELVPAKIGREIAALSGLASFEQDVLKKAKRKGYVELTSFEAPEIKTDDPPERKRLIEVIDDCLIRGYKHRNIAILTPRNRDVVNVSGWLNSRRIPFLSHSSLDIRTRRITGEILALLKFLDSPIDDLSFGTVLLSKLFAAKTPETGIEEMRRFLFEQHQSEDRSQPLYIAFREHYPELWNRCFEHLFNVVGYLPVYDLVQETYRVFSVFTAHPDEEATLVKLLEVIGDFEAKGNNNLKGFLLFAETDSADDPWDIVVAPSEDAVTVMTVHKAKGLGYPVVILLFYDRSISPKNPFIEEEAEEVRLLRITQDSSGKNDVLGEIYKRQKVLEEVDELNKLYVSLTRAEQEMYILSVKAKKGSFPSEFLPPGGFREGTQARIKRKKPEQEHVLPIIHPPTMGLPQSPTAGPMTLEEVKRGDFVHAIFSRIRYASADPSNQIDEAIRFFQGDVRESFDLRSIREKILALLRNPDLAGYFAERPGREVKNEYEITTPDGQLQRLDRLVADTEGVTVIDYKTGGESDEYQSQVRRYMKLAGELYPDRPVSGFLAYFDLNKVQRVG
jgi:ATP-dependent exoDNAse (exonuclease V) beta subunit